MVTQAVAENIKSHAESRRFYLVL